MLNSMLREDKSNFFMASIKFSMVVGSLRDLINQTEAPGPQEFKSILRNSDGLSDLEWNQFCQNWQLFGITSMASLLKLYNIVDCLLQVKNREA